MVCPDLKATLRRHPVESRGRGNVALQELGCPGLLLSCLAIDERVAGLVEILDVDVGDPAGSVEEGVLVLGLVGVGVDVGDLVGLASRLLQGCGLAVSGDYQLRYYYRDCY